MLDRESLDSNDPLVGRYVRAEDICIQGNCAYLPGVIPHSPDFAVTGCYDPAIRTNRKPVLK